MITVITLISQILLMEIGSPTSVAAKDSPREHVNVAPTFSDFYAQFMKTSNCNESCLCNYNEEEIYCHLESFMNEINSAKSTPTFKKVSVASTLLILKTFLGV